MRSRPFLWGNAMRISQEAFDLIVAEEVTSKAYYETHYTRPEWPGGLSGVTIGIGYDLGYATVEKIRADWSKHVDPAMLAVMCTCAGIKGTNAKAKLPIVKRAIMIPWDAALDVFADRDVPNWTAMVLARINAAKDLNPTCLGVIVDLAYNRGASFDIAGERYAEMRAIKADINAGHLASVPADLRSMRRLWPSQRGLRDRRDHEAALWNKGLTDGGKPAQDIPAAPPTPDPAVPLQAGPARTKPTPWVAFVNSVRSYFA
jgi:hypothetical protein